MIDMKMAQEWANELSQFKGYEHRIADLIFEGFAEVEKGRNPDTVLKALLATIRDKFDADSTDVPLPRVQPPHRSDAHQRKLERRAAKLRGVRREGNGAGV